MTSEKRIRLQRLIALTILLLTFQFLAYAQATKGTTTLLKSDHKFVSQLYTLDSTFSNWGLNSRSSGAINLAGAWKGFSKKQDIVVAIVDTGIDFSHPHLRNNIYVKNGSVNPQNFGMDFSTSSIGTTPKDDHGHGTHVSGIVKSIFPEVKILALKYYNPKASGQANLESTMKAFEYAVDQGVDIINYSGGGPEPSAKELAILKKAERKGILVIVAAGNEKSDIDHKRNAYYPASYGLSNIITVSAHNKMINKIRSSNWGSNSVDLSAPGKLIKSSIPSGKAGRMTGTSQATAFVTGVAALIKAQYPGFSSQEIKDIIVSTTTKHSTLAGKSKSGGLLNATNALGMAKQKYSSRVANKESINNFREKRAVAGDKKSSAFFN